VRGEYFKLLFLSDTLVLPPGEWTWSVCCAPMQQHVPVHRANRLGALASPAMWHWGTCPLDFQLFNFSGHFRAAQTLTFDSMWFPIEKEYTGL